MKTARLPSGERVWAVSHSETTVLHYEIFQLGVYDRCGIELADGCTVFDVGANIGLFGVYLAPRLRGARLFTFEPIPAVAAVLRRNAEDCMPGLNVHVFDFAVSDREGQLGFVLNGLMSFTNTASPEAVRNAADTAAGAADWGQSVLADMVASGVLSPAFGRLGASPPMRQPLGWLFRLGVALGDVQRAHAPRSWRPCRPLSAIIDEHGIQQIDLLKVDVEGAELDVLNGIRDEHWPRIRQVAIEVHNVGGRLEAMRALFQARGFRTSAPGPDFELQRLMRCEMIYALRD